VRERIGSLAIPPAWKEVWICPNPKGHLQATGRDEAGRKQYRYHPRWEEVRTVEKFERLRAFGHALSGLRRAVDRALAGEGLGRERVLAAVVKLLESTALRIGNDEYARENQTYGLTTLRDKHVRVEGHRIHIQCVAKGGADVDLTVTDRRLASIVAACQEVPGYEVFKWVEDGAKQDVKSDDVNAFIREATGGDFTAKDFRTWLGTLHAYEHLCENGEPADEDETAAHRLAAVDAVAERLMNTRAVARGSYIHPGVLEQYGEENGLYRARAQSSRRGTGLSACERSLLRLLDSLDGG
jgi:DNA topoisomerase-1